MCKSLVASIDKLPLILKIILAIPVLDGLVYGIYRICKGHIIAGIVWIFLGIAVVGAIIDIISLLLYKKVTLWAD